MVRGRVDAALYSVQRFHPRKRRLRPIVELLDGNEPLVLADGRAITRGYVHLLVPLVNLARGPRGEGLLSAAAAAAAEAVESCPDVVLRALYLRGRVPVTLAQRREPDAGAREPLEQRLALPLRDPSPDLSCLLPSKFLHLYVRTRLNLHLRRGRVLPRAAPALVVVATAQSLAQRRYPPSQRRIDRGASFDRAHDHLDAAVAEKVE